MKNIRTPKIPEDKDREVSDTKIRDPNPVKNNRQPRNIKSSENLCQEFFSITVY